MNWTQSYSSSWRIFRVNRKTWADGELVTNIDEVSVARTADGSLLETGSLKATGDFEADYYRIVMTAQQGGEIERVDVATLLFEASKGEHDYGTATHSIDGHSVLYPAYTTSVTTGGYAPARIDGAQYAKELLESAINAPVEVEGSFTLVENVVHELGSSILEAVWAVLEAGNFVLQIDGRGVVHIKPMPTEPSLIIDNSSTGLLMNGIDYEYNVSEIPNRYVAIMDNLVAVATNDSKESAISTVSRGYAVDLVDTSPILVNGESLSDYAERRLKLESIVKDTRLYEREYAPDVFLYSIVRGSINGLDGDYRVASQSIKCDKGLTLSEKASKEINLW